MAKRKDDAQSPPDLRKPRTGKNAGIIPVQFKLTDRDKAELEAIRVHFGLWSRTDALRKAIGYMAKRIASGEEVK